jgi:hypothetical protein
VPLSRGDEGVDRIIKISNWPQAVVACAGLLAITGMVWALAHAGVDVEVILGAVLTLVGLSGGQRAIARRAASTEAKTDVQTRQLDTIVRQTNGLSDADRARLAEEAADLAAVKVVEAYNRGEMGGPR